MTNSTTTDFPASEQTSPSPWLTAEQAAQRLQVSKKTIYKEVAAGRLRAAIVGGRRNLRFRASWLDDFLDACAKPLEITR